MLELYQDDHKRYKKMFISKHDSAIGARIGGNPPEGVKPEYIDENTSYFATLPISKDPAIELSIFVSFGDNFSKTDIFALRGQIHNQDSKAVQLVVHSSRPRSSSRELASEIPSYALTISRKVFKEKKGDFEEYPEHKLGGIPFFSYDVDSILDFINNTPANGYVHIAQFAFPNDNDVLLDVDWPFAQYVFHVFGKEDCGKLSFISCWG